MSQRQPSCRTVCCSSIGGVVGPSGAVAWCAATNLIAVAGVTEEIRDRVVLIDPCCPDEHYELAVETSSSPGQWRGPCGRERGCTMHTYHMA